MRPTQNREIVFEGSFEARVAAQLLHDHGRGDLINHIVPPIKQPFLSQENYDNLFLRDSPDYTDEDEYTTLPAASQIIFNVLMEESEPLLPGQVPMTPQQFMTERVANLIEQMEEMAASGELSAHAVRESRWLSRPVEILGLMLVGGTAEQIAFARQRHAFVRNYSEQRGWNPLQLTAEQIRELRAQPQWRDPPRLPATTQDSRHFFRD